MNDGARGAHDEPGALGALPGGDRGFEIGSLRADAGKQERHFGGDGAHLGKLARIGRPHHQKTVAVGIPAPHRKLRHHDKEFATADVKILQIAGAGIGRAAQDEHAALLVAQEGLEGIAAEIGIDGRGIRAVALENLNGVALGRRTDVAALGIQDHRDAGVGAVDVFDRALELVFGLAGGIVRKLRLVRAHEVGGGVDDGFVELEDRRGARRDMRGQPLDLRIKADAGERVSLPPRRAQLRHEARHATRLRRPRACFFR